MEIYPLQGCTLARRLRPAYRVGVCPSHPALCPLATGLQKEEGWIIRREGPGAGETEERIEREKGEVEEGREEKAHTAITIER